MVAGNVEDEVVAFAALGEVLLRVVDDMVRAGRSQQFLACLVVDARDLGVVRLGDLNGEEPDAPARWDSEAAILASRTNRST